MWRWFRHMLHTYWTHSICYLFANTCPVRSMFELWCSVLQPICLFWEVSRQGSISCSPHEPFLTVLSKNALSAFLTGRVNHMSGFSLKPRWHSRFPQGFSRTLKTIRTLMIANFNQTLFLFLCFCLFLFQFWLFLSFHLFYWQCMYIHLWCQRKHIQTKEVKRKQDSNTNLFQKWFINIRQSHNTSNEQYIVYSSIVVLTS